MNIDVNAILKSLSERIAQLEVEKAVAIAERDTYKEIIGQAEARVAAQQAEEAERATQEPAEQSPTTKKK